MKHIIYVGIYLIVIEYFELSMVKLLTEKQKG